MNARRAQVMSGLAWIVLSPLALLMALISTVESLTVYYVQVVLFGAWATSGMLSGIGTIASTSWAARLQKVLLWIAFAYFAGSGVLIAVHVVLVLDPSRWLLGWLVAAMVFGTALPFLYVVRRRRHASKGTPELARRPGVNP